MAIYNLGDLRAAVPEDMRNLSDDELVRDYSTRIGRSFEDTANYLGMQPRGTTSEVIRQIGAGAVVDLPKMVGQGLQYTGIAPEYGQEMVQAAEARAPGWEPDMRGRGLVGKALIYGGRGLAPMAPALAAGFVPGGQWIAPAVAGALFGTSSAQETYEKVLQATGDEDAAKSAAWKAGMIQGPGEALATAVGARALKPLTGLVKGAQTTERVAQGMTDSGVWKPLAKSMALNAVVQPGTEVAQDLGQYAVERAYGAAGNEDPYAIAEQSALGGLGLTMLLGPLAVGSHARRAANAANLKEALYGENTDPKTRALAMDMVMQEAKNQGIDPQNIDQWFDQQLQMEDMRTEQLRLAELQKKQEEINLLGGEAQQLQGLQGGMFSSLEQQKAFEEGAAGLNIPAPFGSLDQQRAITQGMDAVRDARVAEVGQQYQDLLARNASTLMQAQDIGQQTQQILGRQQRGLEAAQQAGADWNEIRAKQLKLRMDIEDMGRQWREVSQGVARPVSGELSRGQKAALRGPEGKRLKKTSEPITPQETGPVATTLLDQPQVAPRSELPLQQEVAPSSLLTDRPAEEVSPPGVPAAAASPSAPVAEGISSAQENVPQATETVQAETQGQKPAAVRLADRQTAEQRAQDDLGLTEALQVGNRAKVDNALPAAVEGAKKIAVPGKTALTVQSLRNIRDALLNPSGTVEGISAKEQKVSDAVRAFAKAYYKYSNSGGNMLRGKAIESPVLDDNGKAMRDSDGNVIYKPSKFSRLPKEEQLKQTKELTATRAQSATELLQKTRAALDELGSAVGGNAKDVEAIVRMVKNMVQQKLHLEATDESIADEFEQTGEDAIAKAYGKLDTNLSRGWQAAKSDMFRGASDKLYVRQGALRDSTEAVAAGSKLTPMERAAQGYSKFGKGESSTGLLGVMNYIYSHGTPFEQTISKGVFDALYNSDSAPTLKFIAEGNSRYDPKTHTVYLHRDASAAVTLHEGLHAALQWYAYQNPKAPELQALKASLKRVVNYKGDLSADAKRVQDLLKSLVAGKQEMDAVLELVSYGNTLNEFRRALEAMDSTEAPKGFFDAANRVWQSILTAVQKMLGVRPSVAADVIGNTFKLLEKASASTRESTKGNVLEAAITGGMEGQRTAADTEAKEVGYVDARQFNTVAGKWKTPTQIMFEAVGLGRVNGKDLKFTAAIKDSSGKVAEYIRKNMPTLERMILNFNSRFSNGAMQNDLIEKFKSDQNIGYLQMERVAQHLRSNPADAKPFLDYMDGNETALDSLGKRGAGLKLMANDLRALFKDYIKSLPEGSAERRAFEKVPFTQYLLHPSNVGQIAGVSFGVQKLKGLLGIKHRGETSVDEFKQWLNTDENGDVDMDQPLYQVSNDNGPFGFISLDKFKSMGTPAGTKVDTSLVWKIKQWKDGEYKFSASMTAQQIKDNLTTDELTAALLNTTAALGHTYASRNFINGMAKIGYVDGKATASSVAFDDVAAVNAAFPDRKISDRMVLNVSDDASKSAEIRWKTQRTGTWVRMPASENYGALAGKIVPGPVWNSMVDMHDRAPLLRVKALNDTMAFFKKSKTVYNPGTHVTNILSNVTLAYMHGIPMKTVADAARMFARFEVSPGSLNATERAMVQAFYNSGAVLGNYSSTEVKRTVYAQLSEAITPDSDTSTMGKVLAFAKYEKLKAKVANFDAKATEIYAAEDNIFRLAAFLSVAGNIQMRDNTSMLNKEQLHEAGVAARKLFLDYDIDARAIRAMRQSFMPFISWSYAVMPVLGRIMIEKPWTMANVLLAYGLVSAATGGDDDEELRKAAPEYLRDKSFGGLGPYMHIRLPFLGDDENPVYFNLGKYVPMFTLFQPPAGATKVAGQEWIPGFVSPNGPYATVLSMLNGYDPFTGKPMHDPTDTQWDKLVTTVGAAYDLMAPGIIDAKTIKGIAQLADGGVGPTGVEKSHLALARKLSGLGLYQFNVGESLFFQDNEVKKIKADFTTAMNKAKSKEMSKGYPDYEALDAELEELQIRLDKRIAEIRGEEAP